MPADRLILAFETSNPSAWTPEAPVRPGVALGRARGQTLELLARAEVDPTRRDDELMQACDRAVRAAGVRPGQLTDVAVSVGPGGFTALRVAVTAAKLIAHATGARVLPIPSAQVVAARVTPDGRPFAVALASKTDDAHVSRFSPNREPLDAGLHSAASLERLGVARLIADRFLPQAMRDRAAELGIAVLLPVFDPLACLELAIHAPAVDPLALAPQYPREPEAVRKWRAIGRSRE